MTTIDEREEVLRWRNRHQRAMGVIGGFVLAYYVVPTLAGGLIAAAAWLIAAAAWGLAVRVAHDALDRWYSRVTGGAGGPRRG